MHGHRSGRHCRSTARANQITPNLTAAASRTPGRHRLRHLRQPGSIATLAFGACLCAGQLLTGGPAAATAGTAVQAGLPTAADPVAAFAPTGMTLVAARPARVAPRLIIAANQRRITAGSTVILIVRAGDPRTGKAIKGSVATLQVWNGHGWRNAQTKEMYTTGWVSFATRPRADTTYRYSFRTTNPHYRTAHSSSVTVRVGSAATTSRGGSATGARVVQAAARFTGRPYRFGATGPGSFDCSGLTQYVYRQVTGKRLPRSANQQQHAGRAVSQSQARPGDLIFFRSGSYAYHVGIYAGGGYMYDAPRPGKTVGKHKIWSRGYVVRRVV